MQFDGKLIISFPDTAKENAENSGSPFVLSQGSQSPLILNTGKYKECGPADIIVDVLVET